MTIATLLNAREAVQTLYSAQVDGRTALSIRRAVRQMEQPLADYDAALRDWVQQNDVDGKQIADLTDEQRAYWHEMISADVEQTWEAPLGEDDLDKLNLSAAQLDALIQAGMIRAD